ncbi:hypothetical protein LSAT2_013139 [Lamellibrachia satsuma]|nr:hypothetical protein LSAT2_013139 [Lamellibrachia satsuma]
MRMTDEAPGYDSRCIVFAEQRHKGTDEQYPGDNCTSKMANVRGLLVLSLVCLLLCQTMSLSEACAKKKVKCHGSYCGDFCCPPGVECKGCGCVLNHVIHAVSIPFQPSEVLSELQQRYSVSCPPKTARHLS